jgi:rhodanese-related sulfurtransferase
MDWPWWVPFGRVEEIAPRELASMLRGRERPQILDVRTRAEFEAGHVPGALHVPVSALPARLPSLGLDPGRTTVAICLTAHRSIPAVRLLRRHGHAAVQLAGGMIAWRSGGHPEER